MAASALWSLVALCCHRSATEPTSIPLSGVWTSHIAVVLCPPVDLSTSTLNIQQVGTSVTGVLKAADGQTFEVSGTVQNDTGVLNVTGLPLGKQSCGFSFRIEGVIRTAEGAASVMQVVMIGRCCDGTIESPYQFTRVSGA